MNLEESDAFVKENERTERKRRTVLASIVVCVILAALLFILIVIITIQDNKTLKVFLNDKQYKFSSTFFQTIDNETYVNLEQLSILFGYTFQKGEYKKYNEDPNSCYISNGIETVAITAGTDHFIKYINNISESKLLMGEQEITVRNEAGYSETFSLDNKIQLLNESIYVPFEKLPEIFNTYIDMSKENRIRLYTLENRFLSMMQKLSQANTKYTQLSGEYENIKALVYGLAVVGQGQEFGVISSVNGKEIIGPKYSQMQFIQNAKEFLVNAENTVGLISKEGTTIIPPTEYDEISLLDEKAGIYMVKKGKEYGVLNRKGEVVIYVEYDEIGLKDVEKYSADEIKNGTILFGTSIPVKKDSKYGLYSVDGKEILATEFTRFGYIAEKDKDSSESEESVLLIPEEVGIKGIVVGSNKGYGIYDINAENWIVSDVCTKIFSKTKLGKTNYYFEYNGVHMDLEDYLEQNDLKSIKDDEESSIETGTDVDNTISDLVDNEIVNNL